MIYYKPIRGFSPEFVKAGSDGSIFKYDPVHRKWVTLKPRLRKVSANHIGYCFVTINLNGKRKAYGVASLILKSFGPPRPIGSEPVHLDRDPMNNHPDNLRWGPKGSASIGRDYCIGEASGRSKLTEEQVIEARRLYKEGWSIEDIATEYEVSRETIRRAITGKNWGHLSGAISCNRRSQKGVTNSRAITTEEEVVKIKRLYKQGMTPMEISKLPEFADFTNDTIQKIATRTWKHLNI